MPSERIQRVAEAIKQEVARILQEEIKDPRVGFVTVTKVDLTADLQLATVYFSTLNEGASFRDTELGLKSAAGYVRRLLGERLQLRLTPEIRFRGDPSIAESIRMSKLLDNLKEKDES